MVTRSSSADARYSEEGRNCKCSTRLVFGVPCQHVVAFHDQIGKPFQKEDISPQRRLPQIRGILDGPYSSPDPLTKEALFVQWSKVGNAIKRYDLYTMSLVVQAVVHYCTNPGFISNIATSTRHRERPILEEER